jgi:DNA-binding MarR family transcriptional regulator
MDIEQTDTCYCGATRKAARLITRIYDGQLAAAGMTIPQFSLIWSIGRAGSITAVELADRQAMDRTTLVRALKPLLRDGLVTHRRLSPKARQLAYSLSERGAAKLEQAMPLWVAAQREIEAQAGKARIENVRQTMRELTGSLTAAATPAI